MTLATAFIDRPGLYYDEAIFVPVSLTILGAADLTAPIGLTLFDLPLTQNPLYVGALKAWLMAPVFAAFGVDHATIRLPPILLTAVVLAWGWSFLRSRLGAAGAFAVLLLSATDPALVMMTKVDWGPVAVSTALKVAMLMAVVRFLESGGTRFLVLAAVAALLALWDKSHFVWVMIAVAGGALLFFPDRILGWVRADPVRSVLVLGPFAIAYAAIGAFIVLPSRDIGVAGDVAFGAQFLAQRWEVLTQLYQASFSGQALYRWFFGEALPAAAWAPRLIGIQMAVGCMVGLSWLAGPLRGNDTARWIGMLSAVFGLLWGQVLVTPQATGVHHMPVFWPFVPVQLVLLFGLAHQMVKARLARLHQPLRMATAALVVGLAVTGLRADMAFLAAMDADRGYDPLLDPAVERLTKDLVSSGADLVIAGDWGLGYQLIALAPPDLRPRMKDHFPSLVEAGDPDRAALIYDWLFAEKLTVVVLWAGRDPVMRDAVQGATSLLDRFADCVTADRTVAGTDDGPLWRVVLVDSRTRNCRPVAG